jgi:hypothetical protein
MEKTQAPTIPSMKKTWSNSGNNFFIREVSQNQDKLTPGIYKVEMTPLGELYLAATYSRFNFPYKIYGVESKFINRIVKTYNNTTGNLGILMNGTKGTGKTVTAQLLCNELNLPIIVISNRFDGLPGFINEIQQDVIVFFDEYEKMYSEHDHSILTVMDGVLNNQYRKTFLLTTNKLYISENLLQRPGRVRYFKTFKDLPLETIIEIVNDQLQHQQFKSDTVKFISELETITIDIVKAVISEVNIHEESPYEFKDVFNVKQIDEYHDVIEIFTDGKTEPKEVWKKARVFPKRIEKINIENGEGLTVNGRYIGTITGLLPDDQFTIQTEEWDAEKEEDVISTRIFKIIDSEKRHSSFYNYLF